jgi:hypothetical protein
MALSPAARAALEKFKSQRTGDEDELDDDALPPVHGEAFEPPPSLGERIANERPANGHAPPAPPLLEGVLPSSDEATLFRPEQPKTFEESGISYRVLEGLILKTIKQEGPRTEAQLSDFLRIGVNVFREILLSLHKRELLDTPMPMTYDLTTKGREMTALVEAEDGYIGPAPVSFEAYCKMVKAQAARERRVSMADVEKVFANYPMRPAVKRQLREGFNSQRVMLFYGPPGNGKSLITDNLHRLLKDPILVPHAFEFNSKVVRLYDPAYHRLREELMEREEEANAGGLSTAGKPDRRWLISDPSLVTVGTEFKVEHFEIPYDGQYFAPPHIKANNGIFIFDDLGRQTEDHNMILNQFIYPLEQREALVRFPGGSTLKAPFLQRLFLSTNLNHEEILDDAFKRRLLYQILVDRPTIALWKKIFINEAISGGTEESMAHQLADDVVRWYEEDDRIFRACDPRNLFILIDAALDEGQRLPEIMGEKIMKRMFDMYPAAYRHEAKFYVGAMDSTTPEERAKVEER